MGISKQQIFEIIVKAIKDIDEKNDWSFFDEFVLCIPPAKPTPPAQLEFLEKSTHRENGIHAGNGWGKTSVFAKKHIKFILKHYADGADYKTLNVAITQDQSELVQDEIVKIVARSPMLRDWLIPKDSVVKFPHARIRYSNGAISEFKTTKKKGESIEGKEYGYISVDEVALEVYLEFIRDKILIPRLRAWKDSQIDYGATPKGFTAFYRVLEDVKRKGGYIRGGSAYENPYIDHELLNYQSATKGKSYIEQVIYGRFIDTAGMMFAERVLKLMNSELQFAEITKGREYIEGWDLARGRKKNADATVGYRIEKYAVPYRIVKRWSFQLPWTEKERENINRELGREVERSSIEREIRNAHYESDSRVFLDSTGVGDTLYGMLQDIAKPVDFRGGKKDEILDNLQAVIDADLLRAPYIPELADEMTTYQRDDKDLTTDNLMALAVACSPIRVQTLRKFEPIAVDLFAA